MKEHSWQEDYRGSPKTYMPDGDDSLTVRWT